MRWRGLPFALLAALPVLAGCTRTPDTPAPSLRLADTALSSGAPELALRVAQDALARNPRDTDALLRQAGAEVALGREAAARQSYERVLSLDPNSQPALLGLGRLLLFAEPKRAETLFLQVAAQDPRNAPALNNIGIAADLQGQHRPAQDSYRKAIAADPGMVAAQVNLGLSLALSGDDAGAVGILRPLAGGPAATPRIRGDLALVLARSGRVDEAEQILRADMPAAEAANAARRYQALARTPQPGALAGMPD